MFKPDDLDAHDIEEIICEVAGCEPDGREISRDEALEIMQGWSHADVA